LRKDIGGNMKIYIAGPITGIFNFREKFMAAEEELKAKGHIVLNPSFLPDGLKDYMPICKAMIDQSDALYMLDGHCDSIGATEELTYAREHKKKIFFEASYLLPESDSIHHPIIINTNPSGNTAWREIEKNFKCFRRRRLAE